jgi:hypothetical protein
LLARAAVIAAANAGVSSRVPRPDAPNLRTLTAPGVLPCGVATGVTRAEAAETAGAVGGGPLGSASCAGEVRDAIANPTAATTTTSADSATE